MLARLTSVIAALCFFTACSSGGAGGDACARANACPGVSITTCTPSMECQAECLVDNGCTVDARYMTCVRTRCTLDGRDAGRDTATPTTDTGTADDDPEPIDDPGDPPDRDPDDDEEADSGTGGGWGCSQDSPNSCSCAEGVTDDGKGCSASRLAAPGVCCSNGSRCRCQSISCTSNSSGCSCGVIGAPPTSTSCSGPLCCAFSASSSYGVGFCACYNKPGTGGCAALGGKTVSSCGASTVPCYYDDEHSVSTCE
jgi:hypothetical protein